MAELGSSLFRIQLNTTTLPAISGVQCTWYAATQHDIEGPPGFYNFAPLDTIINGAIAAGIRPAFRVRVDTDDTLDVPPIAPADLLQYTNFVSALATAFLGRVGTYAIQNELNRVEFALWTAPIYATVRAAAYAAIHAVDPAAVVLDSGVTGVGYVYYRAQELTTAGQPLAALEMLDRYSDSSRRSRLEIYVPDSIAALNLYLATAKIVRYVSFVNDVLVGGNRDGVQIHYLNDAWEFLPEFCGWFPTWFPGDHYEVWETGWGWEGEIDPALFDEDDHAIGLVRILAGCAGMGMHVVHQLPYYDDPAQPSNFWNRGLNTVLGLRRAATAYEILAGFIGGVNGVALAWGTGVQAYQFGAVYVAWAERKTTLDLATLAGFADEALITNVYGSSKYVSARNLTLGPIPVYIETADEPIQGGWVERQ